jgi:hypothetical protein
MLLSHIEVELYYRHHDLIDDEGHNQSQIFSESDDYLLVVLMVVFDVHPN